MILSILIPSVPSRRAKAAALFDKLASQAAGKPVEVLMMLDNKQRSIGLKRDALVQSARGHYLAFVDDDDDVAANYVEALLAGAEIGSDVITFDQHSTINGGNPFVVSFGKDNPNEEAQQMDGVWQNVRRQPFHVCAWRRSIAQQVRFPDASYGEDFHWARRALALTKTETHLNAILHFYHYADSVTEALPIFPQGDE